MHVWCVTEKCMVCVIGCEPTTSSWMANTQWWVLVPLELMHPWILFLRMCERCTRNNLFVQTLSKQPFSCSTCAQAALYEQLQHTLACASVQHVLTAMCMLTVKVVYGFPFWNPLLQCAFICVKLPWYSHFEFCTRCPPLTDFYICSKRDRLASAGHTSGML
jgi:hypothetical protein